MIRKLAIDDKQIYIEMVQEFYSTDAVMHPISKKNITQTFETLMTGSPYCSCYVCVRDGAVCGYVLIAKTYSQEGGGFTVWVEELYCLAQHRNKGVGSELLNFVDTHYDGAKRFRIEVEPENETAVKLYKKFGYEFIPYQQMIKER